MSPAVLAFVLILMFGGALAYAVVEYLHRARSAPPAPTNIAGKAPLHLDRDDFRAHDADWLLVVFSSETCSSCAAVWDEVSAYESRSVATQNVEVSADADLHKRYRIESVPLTALADRDGSVTFSFFGPIGPSERTKLAAILTNDD